MRTGLAMVGALVAASPALAEKDFCADRPGLSAATCTLDPGKLQIETSLADWAHSRDAGTIEDTVLIDDALIRYGATRSTELQLGWTTYGFDRTRDRGDGAVQHVAGTGDVTLGLRQSLRDGGPERGPAISLQPFVTLPAGRMPIGGGAWGAGVILPAQYFFSKRVALTIDPEVDALPDKDGDGRHLAYQMVANLRWKISKDLAVAGETFVQRDRDPDLSERATRASLDAMASYQIGRNSQIDLAAYAGLNPATPRIELVLGAAHRF